ncbi:MAG: glycosyltransferase 87 family protein [Gaiellaceae bacterium]
MRPRFVSAACLVLLAGAVAAIVLSSPMGGDYPGPTCTGCDYAGPPIDALTHGDLHGFFAQQPFMGAVSLAVRAPFAWLARLGGGDALWQYRAGLIPCLLTLVLLAVALERRMRRERQPLLPRAVVVGLCIAGPMTFRTIGWGHPEELLGGALCVAAVMAATEERTVLAGLLLGAAIATKQWALLAIPPTLLALPRARSQTTITALLAAGLLTLPMFLGDTARFLAQTHAAGLAWGGETPTNIWWAFAHQTGVVMRATGPVPVYAIPHWLATLSHPLAVLLAVAVSIRYWRDRAGRELHDALELLALLFLIRCLFDPFTISYHHAPFVIALLSFEAIRRRGIPLVSLYAALGLWSMSKFVAPALDPTLLYRAYLAWALPLLAYLVVSVLFPRRANLLATTLRLRGSLRPLAS